MKKHAKKVTVKKLGKELKAHEKKDREMYGKMDEHDAQLKPYKVPAHKKAKIGLDEFKEHKKGKIEALSKVAKHPKGRKKSVATRKRLPAGSNK